ncbi:UNVERIFIED_CONTAM: Coatomer subunit zeta-1 [Sesamum radiatum]|uniref:Coatomer subunit zeta n=1 Tax=Sesamum radiatum TaxID=300843 RepID=A0AAW2V9R6_SESRA
MAEACPAIKNILLLDSEGKRIAVRYFTDEWPTNTAKLAFEKSIFTKTQKTSARSEAEITMLEDNIIVYKNNVDQREALENLDLILLCFDEIVDRGVVLETDASVIAGKVANHSIDDGSTLSEQTISQALATAREHLTRSLLG